MNPRVETLIWLSQTSLTPRVSWITPYQWEASVIQHSITLPWVSAGTVAPFAQPWGSDVKLVLPPQGGLYCLLG